MREPPLSSPLLGAQVSESHRAGWKAPHGGLPSRACEQGMPFLGLCRPGLLHVGPLVGEEGRGPGQQQSSCPGPGRRGAVGRLGDHLESSSKRCTLQGQRWEALILVGLQRQQTDTRWSPRVPGPGAASATTAWQCQANRLPAWVKGGGPAGQVRPFHRHASLFQLRQLACRGGDR